MAKDIRAIQVIEELTCLYRDNNKRVEFWENRKD